MVTTFKENSHGFYCVECRMIFSEPQATCPYCGSIVTNYEELLTNSMINTLINDITDEPPEEIKKYRKTIGADENVPMIDPQVLKQMLEEFKNESSISGKDQE